MQTFKNMNIKRSDKKLRFVGEEVTETSYKAWNGEDFDCHKCLVCGDDKLNCDCFETN